MIDETGQKERMAPDSQSSQSQSDDSEREDSLSQQLSTLEVQNRSLQQQVRESERERERLSSLLETSRAYSPDIGPGGKPLPSQLLDGRPVLKEMEKGDGLSGGAQSHLLSAQHQFDEEEEGEEEEETGDDLLSQLLTEKSHLEVKLRKLQERNDILQLHLAEQQELVASRAELNNDLQKDIEVLRSENSHISAELGRSEEEKEHGQAVNDELRQKLTVCEKKLTQVR